VVRRSLVLGLLAGIFVSLCLALLLELRQRRIRCDDDVIRGISLTLLGRVGKPDLEVGA
jgi:succinoglycan biosynthesis transport protein ExoP